MIRTSEADEGHRDQVVPVSVVAAAPDMRANLKAAIQRVDQGDGVLLLTDLLGGSPTNLCVSFVEERKVEIVTGVNLPMLLKLGALRSAEKPIAAVARDLAEAGQKAIGHVSEALRRMA